MQFLIDTHVFIWLHKEPSRLGHTALTLLEDPYNYRYVSTVTGYEIAQKIRVGKLELEGFPEGWAHWLDEGVMEELPVRADHAIFGGGMQWDNRDPFDRIIVAQASLERMTLVTADERMLKLPLLTVLDARK